MQEIYRDFRIHDCHCIAIIVTQCDNAVNCCNVTVESSIVTMLGLGIKYGRNAAVAVLLTNIFMNQHWMA